MRFAIAAFCLLGLAAAEDIDPKIYAKLFMNNKPLFDKMSQAVQNNIPADGRVLDLGSGPGEPTVTLATMVPNARIVCTDFQPAMNEKAKSRVKAAGLTNVEFATTSADDLAAWQDSSFDAVMMSLVLMFVPDPAKALKEVARVLKPGAFGFTAVWKTLPFYDFAHKVLEEVAGKAMPDFPINPMKLSADNAVENMAEAAGLMVVGETVFPYDFQMGTARDAADGLLILAGGMLKQVEADGDTGATARFQEVAERMFQENGWTSAEGVSIPGNAPQLLLLKKQHTSTEEL